MYEVPEGGVSVAGEIYRVPEEVWQRVEAGEPPNLYCGPVRLADGREIRASSTRASWPRAATPTSRRTATGAPTWRASATGRQAMTMRFEAEPYPLEFEPASTALLIIDMQRDFVEPGGFGELLGNDVSLLRSAIEPLPAGARGGAARRADRDPHPRGAPARPGRLRRPPS